MPASDSASRLGRVNIDLHTLLDTEGGRRMPSLAGWYAHPMAPEAADALRRHARRRLQDAARASQPVFLSRLVELISGFWLERDIAMHYVSLKALCRRDDEAALLELVMGQLLISRKRLGAERHLARGFKRAAQLLAPREYFLVMNRHELLAVLPLTPDGAAPADLETLLTEARVIRRLGGGDPPGGGGDGRDTLG